MRLFFICVMLVIIQFTLCNIVNNNRKDSTKKINHNPVYEIVIPEKNSSVFKMDSSGIHF